MRMGSIKDYRRFGHPHYTCLYLCDGAQLSATGGASGRQQQNFQALFASQLI